MEKSKCITEDIVKFDISSSDEENINNLETSVNAIYDLICKIKNIPIAIQNKIFSVMAEQVLTTLSFMLDLLEYVSKKWGIYVIYRTFIW